MRSVKRMSGRKVGRQPPRAGSLLWGPSWLPSANFVGRVWSTVDGGAELEILASGTADSGWLAFDRDERHATWQAGMIDFWEITVTQHTEVEPVVKALCRRWALARDEDFLDDPDDVGFRARYLTLVRPVGSMIEVRLVARSMARARRAAQRVYERWANMPRMSSSELASLKEDLQRVRGVFDSAARKATGIPTDVSVESLMRTAAQLAKLWGWDDFADRAVEPSPEQPPTGRPVREGPFKPSPIGIGELLFFARPLTFFGREGPRDRQLILPLSSITKGEPVDPEWDRLFEGLVDGTVRAVMEDVSVKALAFHKPGYRPKDRPTELAMTKHLKTIASGDRPWLHVRRVGQIHGVSRDYALLKAYQNSGLRFARCLILVENPAE